MAPCSPDLSEYARSGCLVSDSDTRNLRDSEGSGIKSYKRLGIKSHKRLGIKSHKGWRLGIKSHKRLGIKAHIRDFEGLRIMSHEAMRGSEG